MPDVCMGIPCSPRLDYLSALTLQQTSSEGLRSSTEQAVKIPVRVFSEHMYSGCCSLRLHTCMKPPVNETDDSVLTT